MNPLMFNTLANPSKMSMAEIIHVLECAYQALQYRRERSELNRCEDWIAEALRGLRILEEIKP